jgi:hypothetical protein
MAFEYPDSDVAPLSVENTNLHRAHLFVLLPLVLRLLMSRVQR